MRDGSWPPRSGHAGSARSPRGPGSAGSNGGSHRAASQRLGTGPFEAGAVSRTAFTRAGGSTAVTRRPACEWRAPGPSSRGPRTGTGDSQRQRDRVAGNRSALGGSRGLRSLSVGYLSRLPMGSIQVIVTDIRCQMWNPSSTVARFNGPTDSGHINGLRWVSQIRGHISDSGASLHPQTRSNLSILFYCKHL